MRYACINNIFNVVEMLSNDFKYNKRSEMAISAYIQIKIFARVTRCRFTNFRDIGQYRIHGRMNQFTCITLVIFLSLVLFTFPFFPCSNFSSQLFTFQSFLFKYTYIPSSHNDWKIFYSGLSGPIKNSETYYYFQVRKLRFVRIKKGIYSTGRISPFSRNFFIPL